MNLVSNHLWKACIYYPEYGSSFKVPVQFQCFNYITGDSLLWRVPKSEGPVGTAVPGEILGDDYKIPITHTPVALEFQFNDETGAFSVV